MVQSQGRTSLSPDRAFRLVFDDGQAWQIRITTVHASNSAGIARVEFRIDAAAGPAPEQESLSRCAMSEPRRVTGLFVDWA
jgi:hypothetical protein